MSKKVLAVVVILLFLGMSIPSTGIFVDNNPINSTNADDPVEYWGVLINEGLGAYTLLSYWREILCTHGWEENHLHLVINDNLTKKMVKDAIFWLDEREDSNDISLIYIGAHGCPGFFHLSNGRMSYWELNREINRLESDGIFVLLDPCYSGSAIPFLRKRGRVILTACKANEESIGFEGAVEFGLFGIADNIGNDNGMVSAEEIYGYTTRIPLDSDIHPQMSDKYRGDLNLVFVHLDDRRIDQKQVEFDFGTFPISVGGEDFIAQSFIPYSSKITKIKLGISRWPSFYSQMKVSIKEDLLGEDLTYVYVNVSQFPGGRLTLAEFDFPDIHLIPGLTYYIVCSGSESPDSKVSLKTRTEDVYQGGALYISRDSGETWSYDEDHKDLFFITYDDRNLPPEIGITKPDKALYINDKKILPWFRPFIVGNINIEVKASDPEEKMSYIEFYIDDEFKTYDTDPPYCWTWDNRTPFRFRHTIKVIAYDETEKRGIDEISVWRFL